MPAVAVPLVPVAPATPLGLARNRHPVTVTVLFSLCASGRVGEADVCPGVCAAVTTAHAHAVAVRSALHTCFFMLSS